ncbi:beta-eliminating lyase [Colletotrichum graminicola]|uniref:Beta-eliminating lyase n=1 Tax=Colletotrichum graminicola (strain M1.001 / M2 / FGSC 10212) TaxID=645133 RepID=E3Q4P1_COLGM|nr:beta-eliminating lyase [Colletotrichum graminicola M1.001]EFQ26056.1 beta-eliminating lyase [Colletotrichum graminicola M1.001]WDK23203.1 beta-eliminating lyase [Colletotrichum graminicola]
MAQLIPPSHNALVVRPHIPITCQEREEVLRSVEYNVFAFPAALLTCDFLSDSGTSAMTDVQWAAMLRGDESYGRNSGYYCLLEAFRDIFERDVLAGTADGIFYRQTFPKEVGGGFVNGGPLQLIRPNFFILPQGRCAESLLFSTMSEILRNESILNNDTTDPPALISNGFFDTTGANAAATGFQLHTLTQPGLTDPFPFDQVEKSNPFKGNLDIEKTSTFLSCNGNAARSVMLLLTITNNWAGAQPVSMANIKATAALAQTHDIPLFFDACRFAENAKFIQDFEDGYSNMTVPQVVREMFSHAGGFTISLKKDGLATMGGALCFRDEGMFSRKFGADVGIRLKERQIMCYGNDSCGGMSGRDVMAAAVGLYEVTKEAYLADRIGQVKRFAEGLIQEGIPVLLPPGGHAIFLDMNGFFAGCARSYGEFASVGFTLELLKDYEIRACEAGPFGWEWDKKGAIAQDRDSIPNLVRFAVPRYVMSDRHIEYTATAISALHKRRHTIPGARITRGEELRMRVFQSGLEPVPVTSTADDSATSPMPVSTFLSEAKKDVKKLHATLELRREAWELIEAALDISMQGWGKLTVLDFPSGWRPDVCLNLCPIEYSVAIERNTGKPQLRFLVEAQADAATLEAHQKSALQLTADIQSHYPQTVSLGRLNAVKDLFFPPASQVEGIFAAWHSFVAGHDQRPEWKIYLNPNARGKLQAAAVVREAFERLGMPQAWILLEKVLLRGGRLTFLALDLCPGPQARVKAYVQYDNVGAAELAEAAALVAPDTASASEIRRFCSTLSGGSEGPYKGKAPMTCFGFTASDHGNGITAESAVYFPVHDYANDDAEVRLRLEKYLSDTGSGESGIQTLRAYQGATEAAANRPLQDGRGIHAWVGLKTTRHRGSVITFYLASEILVHCL